MKPSVSVRFRCRCGADVTGSVGTSAVEQTCPRCARRWQANPDIVSTVLGGMIALRRLRRDMAIIIGVAVLVPMFLVLIHPAWLLAAPLVVGIVALIAGPWYRTRAKSGRSAMNTPINMRAAD